MGSKSKNQHTLCPSPGDFDHINIDYTIQIDASFNYRLSLCILRNGVHSRPDPNCAANPEAKPRAGSARNPAEDPKGSGIPHEDEQRTTTNHQPAERVAAAAGRASGTEKREQQYGKCNKFAISTVCCRPTSTTTISTRR